MTRILIAAFLVLVSLFGMAQAPESEVYILDLILEDSIREFKNPVNISNKPGYDNQPKFISNTEVIFSSTFDNQTDIVKYDIDEGNLTRITQTPGSEYSPTPTPDGKYISTIVLETDGTQLLWKYPMEGGTPKLVVPQVKIGYHCWLSRKEIYAFVLGEPHTLQVCRPGVASGSIIVTNPGRSLHRIPASRKISFVKKEADDLWLINSYDPSTGKVEYIAETLINSEDLTWAPNGTILMSKDDRIYSFKPEADDDWKVVSPPGSFDLGKITRMDVSPNGQKLAIVVSK